MRQFVKSGQFIPAQIKDYGRGILARLVKLYYTGSELRENKPLDKQELLISCKPKKDNFILKSANGEYVTIDDPELMSIRPQDVDDVIRRLRIAEQSALALKEKLSEYLR